MLTIYLQHLHVNVAITHSDEWSSALSQVSILVQTLWNKAHSGQGDDSDVLLRVLSDYMVIVRNGEHYIYLCCDIRILKGGYYRSSDA